MSYEDHLRFINAVREVSRYALDDLSPGCRINPAQFFDRLYVAFAEEDEVAVAQAVDQACRFTLLVAPRGGGKTSILRQALHRSEQGGAAYFLFDFKSEIEKYYGAPDEDDARVLFIRDSLKRGLAGTFLDNLDTKIAYVFNALWMFFKQERLHNYILRRRAELNNVQFGENEETLKRAFLRDYAALAEEETFVRREITCSQMILALKATFGFSKFLLVLDNVDRLAVDLQRHLFAVAIDVHHGGGGGFGTIVAIRDKNVERFHPSGEGGDTIEVVSLHSDARERTTPLRLSAPTGELVGKIIQKRHVFAEIAPPPLDLAGDSWHVSQNLFDALRVRVADQFMKERLYNLANHSLRDVLLLNVEFINYLFRLVSDGEVRYRSTRLSLSTPDLLSHLYRWIYAKQSPEHRLLLDVVGSYDRFLRGATDSPAKCDLDIVVLCWLVRHPRRRYTVGDVTRAFAKIGIKDDDVCDALYRLYGDKFSYRYLELGDSELTVTREALEDPALPVFLMPLGGEFASNVITKFEFMHQCLTYPSMSSVDGPPMRVGLHDDIEHKVCTVLSFLDKMREVHALTLLKFKECLTTVDVAWEEFYRDEFCISSQLVLERIVISHLKHLAAIHKAAYSSHRDAYRRILQQYYDDFGSSRQANAVLAGLV